MRCVVQHIHGRGGQIHAALPVLMRNGYCNAQEIHEVLSIYLNTMGNTCVGDASEVLEPLKSYDKKTCDIF